MSLSISLESKYGTSQTLTRVKALSVFKATKKGFSPVTENRNTRLMNCVRDGLRFRILVIKNN